jgi:hypothetical protein
MTTPKKVKNPWLQLLNNVKGTQAFNAWHQARGSNRPVKEIRITEQDIIDVFQKQNGMSKWLNIPIDPMDVFKTHYPLAPSIDRIDNSIGYTPENICIATRFENYGFNKCTDSTRHECIARLRTHISANTLTEFIDA